MTVKALIVDVDQTLYDHASESIPEKHLQALDQMRKQGYKIVLCTGRPLALLENLMDVQPGAYDALVTGAGCAAYDEQFRPLYEKTFDEKTAAKLLQLADELDCAVFCAGKTLALSRESEPANKMMASLGLHDIPVRTPDVKENYSLIEFLRENPKEPLEQVEAMDGVKVMYFDLFTDTNPEGISKITGIHQLMERWGFGLHDYIAFGDSVNDLEMLQDAEIGIAMGNASDKIKEAADDVCGSVSEAGIYTWLDEHGYLDKTTDKKPAKM